MANENGKIQQLIAHGHPYVEIGGVKWATMNVGAKNVTDPGLYFAWGETKGYKPEEVGKTKRFTWKNYKFGSTAFNFSKYKSVDGLTKLQPEDDPVKVNWRGNWRLPTQEEFMALMDNASISEVTLNGVRGVQFADLTYPTNKLFFPYSGYFYDADNQLHDGGVDTVCWTNSLYSLCGHGSGNYVFIKGDQHYPLTASHYVRTGGFSIRGILSD